MFVYFENVFMCILKTRVLHLCKRVFCVVLLGLMLCVSVIMCACVVRALCDFRA